MRIYCFGINLIFTSVIILAGMVSPAPASSSDLGSPNGSVPKLEGTGFRASTMEEKTNEIYLQLPLFMQNAARIENCAQTLAQTVAPRQLRLEILNKFLGALWLASLLWKQMQLLVPVALIQQDLGICLDRVPAPQPLCPLGPMALGRPMTTGITRRRLDTSSSTADEHVRSAVLLRFPCEQYHKGITKWMNTLWEESNTPADNRPVRIHCKAGSTSVRLVFESRAKCQDFVVRYKNNGIPCEIDRFAPLWRELADQLEILFRNRDDEGAFIIPAIDTRSLVLSIKDRRNGVGKPVFKLAPLGSGQTFALVTPELSVPGVPPDVLLRVLSQAKKASV